MPWCTTRPNITTPSVKVIEPGLFDDVLSQEQGGGDNRHYQIERVDYYAATPISIYDHYCNYCVGKGGWEGVSRFNLQNVRLFLLISDIFIWKTH